MNFKNPPKTEFIHFSSCFFTVVKLVIVCFLGAACHKFRIIYSSCSLKMLQTFINIYIKNIFGLIL